MVALLIVAVASVSGPIWHGTYGTPSEPGVAIVVLPGVLQRDHIVDVDLDEDRGCDTDTRTNISGEYGDNKLYIGFDRGNVETCTFTISVFHDGDWVASDE